MTRAPQHAQHAATIDVSQSVDRRGQAEAGPAPEWPSTRCMLIGGVLGAVVWLPVLAWVFS